MVLKVGLLLFPGFSEFEVTVAISLLRASHELVTLALEAAPMTSEAGLVCQPQRVLAEVNPNDLEALIIPGGDMVELKDADVLSSFVRRLDERGVLLAAICSGGYVLARAGILSNRPYTVTFTQEQRTFLGCFDEQGFRYEPVITDGNVITAQGHAFVAFGLSVARQLRGELSEEARVFYEGRANILMEAQADSA